MILSLQGCMAVGKTSAADYLKEHAPYLHVYYEDTSEVIKEIASRQLDKNTFEDFVEIQRLWIHHEIKRWEKAKNFPCTIMDFGAEEIEFYTLNYPKAIEKEWPVEEALRDELNSLKQCVPTRILFLDASEAYLRRNKESDKSRSRNFFDFYLQHLLPLKRQWFLGQEHVDVLNVDGLTREEVGQQVKIWCDRCLSHNKIQPS
jgi:deoxyadenosine/deoxycytidine kinase